MEGAVDLAPHLETLAAEDWDLLAKVLISLTEDLADAGLGAERPETSAV